MEELGKKQENNRLYCDSESAIHLANKSTYIQRLRIYISGTISYDPSWKMDI
jgi:hypothetical protein